MSKTYSAGIVTAYGAAKRAGYQGTYEDFCRQQAQYAQNASAVEQAKQTAVSASQSANQAKQDAQTASNTAQQSAQDAQGSAQSAGQSAQDAQTAKNNAQTYAQSASQSAGSAQQSAQSAQTVLESIPEDYSDLSEDVDQLKADLDTLEDFVINGGSIPVEQTGEIRRGMYISASTGTLIIATGTTAGNYISYVYAIEPDVEYTITTTGNRLTYGLYSALETNTHTDSYVNANDSIGGEHVIKNTSYAYLVVYCGNGMAEDPIVTVYKEIAPEEPEESDRKEHFNILIFGNSYAADAWGYVPFILKKYGITVNIYMYYRGSGSPSRLVAEWEDTGDYGLDIYGGSHVRRMTHIDTRTMTAWERAVGGYSAKMLLELPNDTANGVDKWDIITLQPTSSEQYQVDGQWTMAPGIEPALRQIINLINASYTNTYTLGFMETYNRIVSIHGVPISILDNRIATMQANEAAYKAEPFGLMIPVGAAVFSGRTNSLLSSTDVSDMGNLWSPDLIHLQEGVPCYLAACTVCQAIFNKYFPEYSVLGDDTRITSAILISWNVQFRNGTPKAASELAYQLAQKCAVVANERPFDISPIYMPDDTTEIVYDRSKYWADSMIDTSSITNPTA